MEVSHIVNVCEREGDKDPEFETVGVNVVVRVSEILWESVLEWVAESR